MSASPGRSDYSKNQRPISYDAHASNVLTTRQRSLKRRRADEPFSPPAPAEPTEPTEPWINAEIVPSRIPPPPQYNQFSHPHLDLHYSHCPQFSPLGCYYPSFYSVPQGSSAAFVTSPMADLPGPGTDQLPERSPNQPPQAPDDGSNNTAIDQNERPSDAQVYNFGAFGWDSFTMRPYPQPYSRVIPPPMHRAGPEGMPPAPSAHHYTVGYYTPPPATMQAPQPAAATNSSNYDQSRAPNLLDQAFEGDIEPPRQTPATSLTTPSWPPPMPTSDPTMPRTVSAASRRWGYHARQMKAAAANPVRPTHLTLSRATPDSMKNMEVHRRECPTCQLEFEADDYVATVSCCGTAQHVICLSTWVNSDAYTKSVKGRVCMKCRNAMDPKKVLNEVLTPISDKMWDKGPSMTAPSILKAGDEIKLDITPRGLRHRAGNMGSGLSAIRRRDVDLGRFIISMPVEETKEFDTLKLKEETARKNYVKLMDQVSQVDRDYQSQIVTHSSNVPSGATNEPFPLDATFMAVVKKLDEARKKASEAHSLVLIAKRDVDQYERRYLTRLRHSAHQNQCQPRPEAISPTTSRSSSSEAASDSESFAYEFGGRQSL